MLALSAWSAIDSLFVLKSSQLTYLSWGAVIATVVLFWILQRLLLFHAHALTCHVQSWHIVWQGSRPVVAGRTCMTHCGEVLRTPAWAHGAWSWPLQEQAQ